MLIIYTIYLWETIKYYTILLMILDTLRKIQVNPTPLGQRPPFIRPSLATALPKRTSTPLKNL